MRDNHKRIINYMRLSVTDLCNLRCIYCMPLHGVEKKEHSDILSVGEIDEVVRAAASLGIEKLRVTGGEPLVRGGILNICENAANTPGINEVCITTNGILLPKMASDLKSAGVSRVNLSLDTLRPERFAGIARCGNLGGVVDGLEAARKAGLLPLKINVVLMGGVNDDEIADFVELTRNEDIEVRFIELMRIGQTAEWPPERFLSGDAVLEAVPELEPLGGMTGVARLYALPGARGKVGLITAVSGHFCNYCNKIRITADGRLKPCLHSAEEINIKGLEGDALLDTMARAILSKPDRHTLQTSRSGSLRAMHRIGG